MNFFRNLLISTAVFCILTHSAVLAMDNVSAQSAILIEQSTGDVLFEKNAHQRMPMASTTKIMTALCAIENGDLSQIVKVHPDACGVEGSSIYLQNGDSLTLESLLYALMLESANDAAAAIAYELSGSIDAFAELMNETAADLNLADTHFTNPHGLDDEQHYTTAADLAKLAAHAINNATFQKIVSTRKHTAAITHEGGEIVSRLLLNHNKLLRLSDNVNGVKTGFTKRSGRCLVSSAMRDGVSLIAVTLNAPDDWNDHLALHELGFSSRTCYTLAEPGEFTLQLPCPTARDGVVTACSRDGLAVVRENGLKITHVVEADRLLMPPVAEGQRVGRVVFYANSEMLGEIPLYTCEAVPEPQDTRSAGQKILDLFR